jgi:hypothetical protein
MIMMIKNKPNDNSKNSSLLSSLNHCYKVFRKLGPDSGTTGRLQADIQFFKGIVSQNL